MLSGESNEISAFRCYNKEQTTINVNVPTRKFSVNLSNCVNLNSGLSYAKTGQVKISIILAQSKRVLFGTDITVNTSYKLANLQCNYKTAVDDPNLPTEIIVNSLLKQNLSSGVANLIMLQPQPTSKIAASMIRTS